MVYWYWDMARGRCNYFWFWAIFCPFTYPPPPHPSPPNLPKKLKISKNWKKPLEISSFYTSITKIMITCYTVPEIWHVTDVIVIFHFRLFFALLPPKKSKFQKMKKTPVDIIILQIMIRWCVVPEIWCTADRQMVRQMDGWMNGRKKWHTEVGAAPKNEIFQKLISCRNISCMWRSLMALPWYKTFIKKNLKSFALEHKYL